MFTPQYPTFRPLTPEDKPAFDAVFAINPPQLSEYTFTNLYAWRRAYHFELSQLGAHLLLASDREGQRSFFDPLGPPERREVMARVLSDDPAARFIRLPENTVTQLAGDPRYCISADRDHFDYLYASDDLIRLRGNRYHAKRNLISGFKTAHPGYEYLQLSEATRDECLGFEERWCLERKCDDQTGLGVERVAVREMLNHFTAFGLSGGAIRLAGEMVAAALAERLNSLTLVLHMLKAAPGVNGLYQTCLHDFLEHEAGALPFVNLEQDLGLSGLRQAKLSYHPARLIEKYILYRI